MMKSSCSMPKFYLVSKGFEITKSLIGPRYKSHAQEARKGRKQTQVTFKKLYIQVI